MKNKIVAGIGSRGTPDKILDEMRAIGRWCKENGIFVRSGHADGADMHFEYGAQDYCLAYLPWEDFNAKTVTNAKLYVVHHTPELNEITDRFHPAPHALTKAGRKLMNRNVCQVLGAHLDLLSELVICWTSDGRDTGGTGQAIRIANGYGVPVINMYHEEYNTAEKVIAYIKQKLF